MYDVVLTKDIAIAMIDSPFGSKIKNDDYVETGALVVQGKNVQGRKCEWKDRRFLSIEKWQSLVRHHVELGDIIFPKVGTIGKAGLLTPLIGVDKYVVSTNTMSLRVNTSKADPDFIYYFFTSPATSAKIIAQNANSVQPVFNFTSLKKFPIPLPPLSIQKEIGKTLRILDNKIELNNQMNQTLESMARAIFKEWFIDFGPVKAKAAGKKPFGMDDETAALFPDSFEESELGLIPKGWKIGKLLDICDNKREIFKGDENISFSYLGLEHLPQGSFSINTCGSSSSVVSHKFKFKKNDILFGKLRPYFKKVIPTPFDGVCSTDILVLIGKKSSFNSFILLFSSSEGFIEFNTQSSQGTKMPRTSWEIMNAYQIVLPDECVLVKFHKMVEPLIKKISDSYFENELLIKTQDLLLPKLISGDLKIKSNFYEVLKE